MLSSYNPSEGTKDYFYNRDKNIIQNIKNLNNKENKMNLRSSLEDEFSSSRSIKSNILRNSTKMS
jgi:hypothetical protein